MKKLYFTGYMALICLSCFAQSETYFEQFRNSNRFDHKLENTIIKTGDLDQLQSFYTDSIYAIRRQAYYLCYKIGQNIDSLPQQKCTQTLLGGLSDQDPRVVQSCLNYLKSFSVDAYSYQSLKTLDELLQTNDLSHFKETYLLAGFLGVGLETIQRQLSLSEKYSPKQKWAMHLALSRLGHTSSTQFCCDQAQTIDNGNNKIAYLIPDLIYTRQRDAIDYCITILYSESKDCYSPNPDMDQKILCGYRVLELLTPIIQDFPFTVGAAGALQVNDYQKALIQAREWFKNHPNYNINNSTY